MSNNIKHSLSGRIYWSVSKNGATVRESRTYSNLILDQGLDFIASYAFADCFRYCALGNGSLAPNKLDASLTNEVRRTNNYSVTSGSNGASVTNNVYRIFRTFVFSSVEYAQTFRELGFSPLGQSGANLFSKALFKDSGGVPTTLVVNPGETLSIRYELSIEIFDASKTVRNAISGQTAYVKFQKIGLMGISPSGETVGFDDLNGANEPSTSAPIFLSNSSAPPDQFGSCVERDSLSVKMSGRSKYVPGSYGVSKTALFKPSERATSWRSVGVGNGPSHGAILVFNSQQTADSSKAYLVTFKYFWVHQNSSNFSIWLDGEDYLYLNKRLNKVNTYSYFAM